MTTPIDHDELPLPSAVRHYTLQDVHPPDPSVDDLLVTIAYLQRRNEELTQNLTACQERCTELVMERRKTALDHHTAYWQVCEELAEARAWSKRWKRLAKRNSWSWERETSAWIKVVAEWSRKCSELSEENDTLIKALDKAKSGVAKCQG